MTAQKNDEAEPQLETLPSVNFIAKAGEEFDGWVTIQHNVSHISALFHSPLWALHESPSILCIALIHLLKSPF